MLSSEFGFSVFKLKFFPLVFAPNSGVLLPPSELLLLLLCYLSSRIYSDVSSIKIRGVFDSILDARPGVSSPSAGISSSFRICCEETTASSLTDACLVCPL